jgi:hypothetical protein
MNEKTLLNITHLQDNSSEEENKIEYMANVVVQHMTIDEILDLKYKISEA